LSKKAKLSVFKTVFVPILIYGHESWVLTKRIRLLVQASSNEIFAKNWKSYVI